MRECSQGAVRAPQAEQQSAMTTTSTTSAGLAGAAYLSVLIALGGYFGFAAVQGDHGLFTRIQADARAEELARERDALAAQLAHLRNQTTRLSDAFLDLDLLDERARKVLGYVRHDEIVIP